jgi:hypothetical protein
MSERPTNEMIIFRASREDKEAIKQVAHRLNLNSSEVSRRAVRVGLRILNDANMPGSRIELKKRS